MGFLRTVSRNLSDSVESFQTDVLQPETLISPLSEGDFANVFAIQSAPTVQSFGTPSSDPQPNVTASFAETSQPTGFADTQPSDPSLLDRIGSIFGNVLDAAKTTAEASVRGAIEGGTVASEGASGGARIGAASTGLSATVLLALGVFAILLLRR